MFLCESVLIIEKENVNEIELLLEKSVYCCRWFGTGLGSGIGFGMGSGFGKGISLGLG